MKDLVGRFRGVAPSYPFALPADVFFTRGTGKLSRLIRWAERSPGEDASWTNHVGVVTSEGFLIPPDYKSHAMAMVSEALWHVEHHKFWDHYKNQTGAQVALFRPLGLDNARADKIVANALTRTGDRYAWWRLLTFLGERLTRIPFTKLHFLKERNVCSNHVGLAMEKGGVFFGQKPSMLDPDEQFDYCLAHPQQFKFVGYGIVPDLGV